MFLLLALLQEPGPAVVESVRSYLRTGERRHLEGLPDWAAAERAVRPAWHRAPSAAAGTTVSRRVASDIDPSVEITYHLYPAEVTVDVP